MDGKSKHAVEQPARSRAAEEYGCVKGVGAARALGTSCVRRSAGSWQVRTRKPHCGVRSGRCCQAWKSPLGKSSLHALMRASLRGAGRDTAVQMYRARVPTVQPAYQ